MSTMSATSVSGEAEIIVDGFSVASDLPPLDVVAAGADYQPPSGELEGRQEASLSQALAMYIGKQTCVEWGCRYW